MEPVHIHDLVESMNVLSELPRNRLLLASLDLRRLMSHLEHVPCRRGRFDLGAGAGLEDRNLQSEDACRFPYLS